MKIYSVYLHVLITKSWYTCNIGSKRCNRSSRSICWLKTVASRKLQFRSFNLHFFTLFWHHSLSQISIGRLKNWRKKTSDSCFSKKYMVNLPKNQGEPSQKPWWTLPKTLETMAGRPRPETTSGGGASAVGGDLGAVRAQWSAETSRGAAEGSAWSAWREICWEMIFAGYFELEIYLIGRWER